MALLWPACSSARPVVIVGEEFAPYKFMEGSKPTGIDIDVVSHVLDKLGLSYEIHIVPWTRAWHMLENGEADIGLSVSYTAERAEAVLYPSLAVWNADFVFFANRRTLRQHSFASLEEVAAAPPAVKIGVIRANSYAPVFWEFFPYANVKEGRYHPRLDPAPDAQTNMRKLDADRIQLYPLPLTIGSYLVRKMNLANVGYYDWVIFSKPYPSVFAKKSDFSSPGLPNIEALMHAYERELALFKANKKNFSAIFDKYLAPVP
jgi:polar amino acid transport system substrate-binding protein